MPHLVQSRVSCTYTVTPCFHWNVVGRTSPLLYQYCKSYITVFWVVTLCSSAAGFWCSGGTCCFHYPENGGYTLIHNIGLSTKVCGVTIQDLLLLGPHLVLNFCGIACLASSCQCGELPSASVWGSKTCSLH